MKSAIPFCFRVSRGYVTSNGDADDESVSFFESEEQAIAYAIDESRNLREIKRGSLVLTEEVTVETLDGDGEPIGQPIFWAEATKGGAA